MKKLILISVLAVLFGLSSCTPAEVPTYPVPSQQPQQSEPQPVQPTVLTPEQNTPATFSIASLSVSPSQIQMGGTATVSVTIKNTGGALGVYNFILYIDSDSQAEKNIALEANSTQTLAFALTLSELGSHKISVEDNSAYVYVVERTSATYSPQLPTSIYNPPIKSSMREFYLNQAESSQMWAENYQRQADSYQSQADATLARATSLQTSMNMHPVGSSTYNNLRISYEDSMSYYNYYRQQVLTYQRKSQDYQREANDYLLKAMREP